ncbi:phosphoribosyl-dephospho-CoA transferase [Virgibacillus natechei]|uniref:Phosphoribosyl-dephospho-CoA transferase n=1 Tax=Virgibacillus natechei TaxID=1216297 RepID=A0ABS4IGG0_9BACI|nr:malonate decarboxylase holo-ACP synthase [Virgibacillus natechei]MBP1970037.1 phosphoribosyl-dephospho-CoA transferase [Virgibacillus natechei]UZD14123.1 malonate decarboxylase holo-ACP synthase [Virgibacillus natechei]
MKPHDLLLISSWGDLQTSDYEDIPEWVKTSLSTSPIVVVRWGTTSGVKIPVGIRGSNKAQRYAAYIMPTSVKAHYRPADLTKLGPEYLHLSEAKRTFKGLKSLFDDALEWGPAGSVGFEMVSGQKVTTLDSDFDIVITPQETLGIDEARTLLEKLSTFSMFIDAQVLLPVGAFSLREWAKGRGVLLKTANLPQLVDDPWRWI